MNQELQGKFLGLACGLSDENIWMDGEATPAQARKRKSDLLKQWKALEVIAGRRVSEDEIWERRRGYYGTGKN
jgi:hypothetical protein